MSPPLVSCVMPTYGRPEFVAESLAMFLAQDYPARELIILNDCPGQTLHGEFPGVRIINASARWATLGEKRNAAIELAKGEFIAVWDDDDVYLPWRLSHSMRRIQELRAALYCPADYWAYWGDENLHENQALLNWIYHPLVVFRRELWETVGGYPAQTLWEDTAFFKKVLEHLGTDWPRDEIARCDRMMILRGKSKYIHTSIPGGAGGPDIEPREIHLEPCPIHDPVLRSVAERLVSSRKAELKRNVIVHETARTWPGVAPDACRCWLDQLEPTAASVGYGEFGRGGRLGYEGKSVEICGQQREHSLSTHAPARLVYSLEGCFSHFCCQAAINDDVPCAVSPAADFMVVVDGQLAGIATNVRPRQVPRRLMADVSGAQELELLVRPHGWDHCHAVWVDPCLVSIGTPGGVRTLVDGLQRAEITVPLDLPETDLCIATVGSPGFETWIDDLFGSVCANAQCPEALLAIFCFGESAEIRRVAEKYRAVLIRCRAVRPVSVACKAVLYSAGRVIKASRFICLDADMLVLGDLRPIVAAIEAAPPGSILACREATSARELGEALHCIYAGKPHDLSELLADDGGNEMRYPFVVNDGLFAGSRAALCAVDDLVRGWPQAADWVDDPRVHTRWRNQFIFNLALARGRLGVELDARYNVQLNSQSVEFRTGPAGITATAGGREAAVVHFNGGGRGKGSDWRGGYRAINRPLTRTAGPRTYEAFLDALRKWIGRHGIDGLSWSFYGTTDGQSARVGDTATLSLLATLHYLIRSNGCSRVVETGTARGVSAACLASAVAHRSDSRVVTIDAQVFPERETLWATLPPLIRRCIVPRQTDAIDGLRAAIVDGETYHAALLDSVHTAEHVLREFELARQLVCPGGLILIHDPVLRTGSVGEALDIISEQGYGVVRLWTAEDGVREDDALGLAVIENRCRRRSVA